MVELSFSKRTQVEAIAEQLRHKLVGFTDIAPIMVNDDKMYFVTTQKHVPKEPALFIVDDQLNVYLTNHEYVNHRIMRL